MKPLCDAVVAIVGLGLMGGSLALALREKNACKKIFGIAPNAATCAQVLSRGVVDEARSDLSLASDADVIVLATPVRTVLEQLSRVGEIARAGAIIMDLGSTKREIVQAMEGLPTHVQPIGAHPLCGKETSGFDAAEANLYRDAVFVLTPLARTASQTLAFAESFAAILGAHPIILDAARHDKIVAAISHLPFVLAATLMTTTNELARMDNLLFMLAASGFRDTSRLAASDTMMMLDILLTNSDNVADSIRTCTRHLTELADWIVDKDENTLRAILESAAVQRRELFK